MEPAAKRTAYSECTNSPCRYRNMPADTPDELPEIAFTGDLTEHEHDLTDKLLSIPPGGECLIYFDSPGGSAYAGLALMSLIKLRGLRATGIVAGECSSAALWPFAACTRRLVTQYSVLLFHPMRWQSEERVGLAEAHEWARHFRQLEGDMDQLLAELFAADFTKIHTWLHPGRYVMGPELVELGLAELLPLGAFAELTKPPPVRRKKKKRPRTS
jgi:ATP-dependent protease ClpP protease subunit